MTTWHLSVVIWTASGLVGLALALVGLRRAREDRRAVAASGRNGLLEHLSRAAVRASWVRAAIQASMLVFAALAVTLPPPVLPDDAGTGAVVRLYVLRWTLSAASLLLVAASALDLAGRRRAGEIVGKQSGGPI